MEFTMLLWGLVAVALILTLSGAWLVISFWLRCDLLQEQKEILQHLLDSERTERIRLTVDLMEQKAAVRAERFHVEQLRRKLELLRLSASGDQ